MNEFFNNKRRAKAIKIIPLGGSIKKAFLCLENNEAIAILADRDFSGSDLVVKFFGRDTVVPKGVGVFNLRKSAAIVPCFMIREPDNAYTFTFERPVEYHPTGDEPQDMRGVVGESLKVIEGYVRRYPDQWFMFDDLWPAEAR